MRKLLQNKAVVSALSVIAVASVAANFVKLPTDRFRTINARAPDPDVPAAGEGHYHIHGPAFAALAARPWRELYPIDPDARDPFAPMVLPAPVTVPVPRREDPAAPAGFRLQATSLDGTVAYAVINQTILREGESIAGYRVEQIRPQQVRLAGPLGSIVIDLNRSVPAQNPATGKPANADLPAASGTQPPARSKPNHP